MRVLASAEFHGSSEVCGWFVGEAQRLVVDAVVLAGDLFGYADEVDDPVEDQRINAREIVDVLASCKVPLLYIMGNDDHFELEPAADNCNLSTIVVPRSATSTSSAISTPYPGWAECSRNRKRR